MSLRRQLGVSLLVQGAGAASVLLATLWLGASLGPEQQGAFSRTKAEIEFVAAFAMFGLPQALFYFVKSARLGEGSALRWAAGSALLALMIGAVYAAIQRPLGGVLLSLALAVAACAFQGQLRALLLVHQRTEWFNAVTALPQVLVLIGVLVLTLLSAVSETRWPWLFALAYGLACAFALWRLNGAPQQAMRVSLAGVAGWRELGRYGLASWLTAALSTAAILLMQRWVETLQGAAGLGQFTMAMALVQVPLTPVSYAAPLLLRRWMEQPGASASRHWAAVLFATLLAAAVLMWLAAPMWPHLGLGATYGDLTRTVAVLLVGGAAEVASRLLAANAGASGTPWIAVRAEATRWLVLGAGWLLPLPPGLLGLCALWAMAALAAAAVFALHARAGAVPQEAQA